MTWGPLSSFWQCGAPKKPKILGMSNAKVNYYLKMIAHTHTHTKKNHKKNPLVGFQLPLEDISKEKHLFITRVRGVIMS